MDVADEGNQDVKVTLDKSANESAPRDCWSTWFPGCYSGCLGGSSNPNRISYCGSACGSAVTAICHG